MLAYEQNLKVRWADTIGNMEAPTVGEVDGADHLTPHLPTGGVDRPSTQNQASLALLNDAFVAEQPGTWGAGPITLTAVRDPDSEDANHPWQKFSYGKSGYLLFSPNDKWTDGDEISVYKVKAHEPAEMPSAENTIQQFTTVFPVEKFVRRATIVAS